MIKSADLLSRMIENVIGHEGDEHGANALARKLESHRPLRIKYGVDVTAPFLHLGHAVNLWAMRELQDMGHKVVFLIGDFTTQIGDPTGKNQTRPKLSQEAIEANGREFLSQVGLVLDQRPEVFEVRRNSEWYGNMPAAQFLQLCSMVTHAQLVSRDMFQKRIANNQEIHMDEMLYPLLQGYDSVMLKSDLTIVGSDQLFNEKMGRFYQSKFGQTPQMVATTRITPGLDGVHKQSKSLNNYVALLDTPTDKFGKLMSLPDSLIVPYMEVYTALPNAEIAYFAKALQANSINPRDAKLHMAHATVTRYHGEDAANKEKASFLARFSRHEIPENAPIIACHATESIMDVASRAAPQNSKSEMRRLFAQGAVRLDNQVVDQPHTKMAELLSQRTGDNDKLALRVGKRVLVKLDHAS